jgi:hypothetical protein
MYGDTEAIRQLARDQRRRAEEVRWEAGAAGIHAAAVIWEGRAADAMRSLVAVRCAELRRVADLLDTSASALDTHAAAVEAVKALIASIEARVRSLVAAARARLAEVAATLASAVGQAVGVIGPDPLDELLDRFVPPPPGHIDWLRVSFPGIDLPSLPGLGNPVRSGTCAA